jgi:hypothetical protein
MRAVSNAICTSGEPVSLSPRLYSAMMRALVALSSAMDVVLSRESERKK